jgi:hypothetical protein
LRNTFSESEHVRRFSCPRCGCGDQSTFGVSDCVSVVLKDGEIVVANADQWKATFVCSSCGVIYTVSYPVEGATDMAKPPNVPPDPDGRRDSSGTEPRDTQPPTPAPEPQSPPGKPGSLDRAFTQGVVIEVPNKWARQPGPAPCRCLNEQCVNHHDSGCTIDDWWCRFRLVELPAPQPQLPRCHCYRGGGCEYWRPPMNCCWSSSGGHDTSGT